MNDAAVTDITPTLDHPRMPLQITAPAFNCSSLQSGKELFVVARVIFAV
jgi:hypothetical protein